MIFVDGEVIKINGKEEDFLAEGCAMIGTILTMVEVKYGEEEREEFLNIAMEMGRKEIEQIMKEISEEPKEDKLKNRRDFINGDRRYVYRTRKKRKRD